MSGSKVFPGIDLGTSNASMAFVVDEPRHQDAQTIPVKVVEVPIDEAEASKSTRFPSVVSRNFDKRKKKPLLGWEFFRLFKRNKRDAQLYRHGRDFFRSVKSDMGTYRIYPHAFSSDFNTPARVSAEIIKKLLDVARHRPTLSGQDLRKAHIVITVPASFSALAREETLQAAHLAGLQSDYVELLDEPVAALVDLLNDSQAGLVLDNAGKDRHLLVFDYGGGTCDLALVQARFDRTTSTGLHVKNLAISQYRRLGGDDVDRAVMAEVIWPQICDRNRLKTETRRSVEDTLTYTVARALKESLCRKVSEFLDQNNNLWSKLQRKPIKVIAPVDFPAFLPEINQRIPPRFEMTSDQFEKLMAPFLKVPSQALLTRIVEDSEAGPGTMTEECPQSLLVPIFETLYKAGLATRNLDAIILHGGSCRNPYVHRLLSQHFEHESGLFGSTKVFQTPDLDASVARGAALVCYWKHARGKELIRPIMPEDLGVITLNDEPVCLVEAGTPVPYPDEDGVRLAGPEFYVPRDGQSELLVPVYTGSRPRVAGSVTVPLPAGVRQGAGVRIKLTVNSNKQLRWWFSIQNGPDVAAGSINDPWTARLPSAEWQKVMDHRRTMRQILEQGEALPLQTELTEARLLYEAHCFEDVLLTIEECTAAHGESALALNLKGLSLWYLGKLPEAVDAIRRAVELDPENPTIRGNYGCALAAVHQTQEAIAAIRMALARNPELAYLYEWLGDLYRETGDESSAMREYQRAEMLIVSETSRLPMPNSLDAWRMRERIHRKLGEYEKADEVRRALIKMFRDAGYGGDSSNMLGVVWLKAD